MKYQVYAHLNPFFGFIHHGGRAGGVFLLALVVIGVLAVVMLVTADKSK